MKIALAEYDPGWAARFEAERERLQRALGELALRVEHIGSTSVPGLAAKPVVDIVVGARDIYDPRVDAALRRDGYELYVDEPGHRMYRTPQKNVHVHLWVDNADLERHITFRDWLRAHPEDVALYEHVKRAFAQRDWRDSNEYADAKTPVINAILRRAAGQQPGPRIDAFAAALARFLPAGARVLEIGSGEGALAERLSAAGHDVVALDRVLRSRFPIVETSFEDYGATAKSFDCIAAQLVLHHAENLDATLEKAGRLLRERGIIAIDDYGWERSGDPAFRADRSDLLTSQTMLAALRVRFDELFYEDHAYFNEGAGTDRLGFIFIGRRRLD